MTDKMETERIKANLETDRVQLLKEKNSLIAKRKELRIEIITLNRIRPFNFITIINILSIGRNKLKAKRPPPFNNLKKNLQRFFTRIRYYQEFYQ